MSLPIITLDNDERWDCHQCGFCCRGSIVPLSDADVDRLRAQNWHEEPEYRQHRIMVRARASSKKYRLAHRSDGSCVFLNPDGLCRIHSKFGFDAKPTICQTFPLQLVPHEKQAVLTIRRACPSAAADLGTPLAQQADFVRQLVRQHRLTADAIPAPLLKSGERRDWPVVRSVMNTAGSLLRDQRYPPVRRLVHVLQLASLLEQAKTRSLTDQQIGQLVSTLADLAPEESKLFFAERAEPKSYSKTMFRLQAIDLARIHPRCRHQSKWSSRLSLMKIAARVLVGAGRTPQVDAIYPRTTFAALEKPLGVLRPEVYQPLTRLLETTSSSFLYALADRPGWTVVESIRGLAVLYPLGLYLLRWLTDGREPSRDDMLHIVVALDRSQGYAPLSGLLHRFRLSALSTGNQLERLVVWYAQ